MRRKAAISARARRSRKNVFVCMAASFSATATTKNRFMLVLSAALILSTAAFNESGSRSGKTPVFVVTS
jgi:hypothetical protein